MDKKHIAWVLRYRLDFSSESSFLGKAFCHHADWLCVRLCTGWEGRARGASSAVPTLTSRTLCPELCLLWSERELATAADISSYAQMGEKLKVQHLASRDTDQSRFAT